jgi:hypothetical protein
VIGAFLAITIPQYSTSRRLNSDLSTARARIDDVQQQLELAKIRDAGGMLFIEVNRRNWGNASHYATDFFNRAQSLAKKTTNDSLRAKLQSMGQQREAVFAALASSDATVQQSIASMLDSLPQPASGGS